MEKLRKLEKIQISVPDIKKSFRCLIIYNKLLYKLFCCIWTHISTGKREGTRRGTWSRINLPGHVLRSKTWPSVCKIHYDNINIKWYINLNLNFIDLLSYNDFFLFLRFYFGFPSEKALEINALETQFPENIVYFSL